MREYDIHLSVDTEQRITLLTRFTLNDLKLKKLNLVQKSTIIHAFNRLASIVTVWEVF
jgi:hypothetical protein